MACDVCTMACDVCMMPCDVCKMAYYVCTMSVTLEIIYILLNNNVFIKLQIKYT